MKPTLSKNWKLAIMGGLMLALILRFAWPEDMDYFGNQRSAFEYSQSPWWDDQKTWIENGLGVISSVGLWSPGLTKWSFQLLAKPLGIKTPVGLSLAVRSLNIIALLLLLFFCLRVVDIAEREAWLWGWMLMLVNPFALLFQRRVWPPCFIYFLFALLLIGLWRREKIWGSFLLGLTGALISQLHMLAGLLYLSLLIWAWSNRAKRTKLRLGPWFFASIVGAIPAIPWLVYFVEAILSGNNAGDRVWEVAAQFRFWRYWLTQPFGLLLTYTLEPGGYFREFLGYPSIGGKQTYFVAVLHFAAAFLCAVVVFSAALSVYLLLRTRGSMKRAFWGVTETDAVLNAGFFGYGALMTAKTFYIFRHYLIASAPLELTWVAHRALMLPKVWGKRLLTALFFCQFGISCCLLLYIHQNDGAPGGEYGHTYRRQVQLGIWIDNNNLRFHRDVFKPSPPKEPVPWHAIRSFR